MAYYLEVSTLRQWPYKKLTKADQHVVARFFDSKPFFAHGWEIYHYETDSQDYFLIPFTQVSEFFAQITAETELNDFRDVSPSRAAFHIDRKNDDEPVFIGTIESKDDFDRLKESNAWNDDDVGSRRGPQSRSNKKVKQQEKRRTNMAVWRAQVKSAIRYLRFPGKEVSENYIEGPVFVSVDVESYEFNHNAITEIGISILDTTRLPPKDAQYAASNEHLQPGYFPPRDNIPTIPSSRAEAILALVESHHFRIIEYQHLRNGTYVNDAVENFEFGSSEYISLREAPAVIARYFRHIDRHGERRKIVLVGHDIKTDIDYLKKLGYNVNNIADLEIIDTASMWKAMKWETQSRSLSGILLGLELEYWNLHNAGNDAAYTLQAVIKMAEKGLPDEETEPGKSEPSTTSTAKARVIVRAEDIEIGAMESNDDASTRPIGWKAVKQGRAVAKPAPIPIPTATHRDNSSDDGSPLSVDGDGW